MGILEGTQGQWFDLVKAGDPIEPWFEACLVKPVRFRSLCGQYDLIVGVPKHCEKWRMPEKTVEQSAAAKEMWREISQNTLLKRIEALESALRGLQKPASILNDEPTHPGLDSDS